MDLALLKVNAGYSGINGPAVGSIASTCQYFWMICLKRSSWLEKRVIKLNLFKLAFGILVFYINSCRVLIVALLKALLRHFCEHQHARSLILNLSASSLKVSSLKQLCLTRR